MLYPLHELADVHILFNLFVYQTFRAAGAVVTSLLLTFVLGPPMIRWLTRLRVGQVVRREGPEHHLGKAGTPTMGGVLIISAATISALLWARLDTWYTWIPVVALVWMGLIGFVDDYLKVVQGRTDGLAGRFKILGQTVFGIALGVLLLVHPLSSLPGSSTGLPFFSDYTLAFWPPAFVVFVILVIAGSSNAVNLTDGLDGLAAGLAAIAAATFSLFAYLAGRAERSEYLGLIHLPTAGEMGIFGVAVAGGAIGFLWYNAHPAEVFMGDTGSLALGGAIGSMAILLKSEFLLVIIGGVFVLEALSVILQTSYFKYSVRRTGTGRRIFRMAPLHHHFEQLGWPETKVVIRFWILGILCAMVAFTTLKVR